ncbi:MAG: RNase adaptor protein RapZ [Gammaproteobacteria bacterium RIFOXYA12_FULL_61_12]|nr:MAG: RNase adaptor protein RapZ [Gammaproteobacteria bacterium RIFOXYD12_FULL_61_37]OGT93149.1 MAG: RNase adaptor protein RapZ [Gammaproteobacteria bacterium RIFOXYA12_FULL_61_12]
MKLVIVTGLSGAGKSTALDTLEDLGFYCIDNLPVPLLTALGKELLKLRGKNRHIAVGVDVRSEPQNLRLTPGLIGELTAMGYECKILFLEAADDILIKRFSETRRKHPLSNTTGTLAEAIRLERNLLNPLSDRADLRIDTRNTHVHQLRKLLRDRFTLSANNLSLQFQSFGFKHGVPTDADFVFDVRCLPNPHWQPDLRPLTGRDKPVIDFLESSGKVERMKHEITQFLENWIGAFEEEGRSYLTVALGCTGGRHRSVYMAEFLGNHFNDGERKVTVRHREEP